MKTINEHIKQNSFVHVYLLYGKEQQAVRIYRNKLLKALLGTDSLDELKQDMNFSLFVGTPFDVSSAIEIASSYPFFAEKRVILIENSKAFSAENAGLAKCIRELPETNYVIFTEEEISSKKGLFEAIKEVGYVCEINEQPQGFIEGWIIKELSFSGKRISRTALDTLLNRTGMDMMRIKNEMDKLIAYKGEDTDIKVDDVLALVSENPQNQVFKMVDAMSEKKVDLAMQFYSDLLELKVAPQKILSLIERQMRILYQVKDLRSKGFSTNAIADSVKGIKYVNKLVNQASKFSMKEITDCMNDCVDLNLKSRTGALTDRMAVELIIVKYSQRSSTK
ncbi:DNA polymerase III, delta subunit [Lachnospiraceae bacterium G41]|nr:DNA polymerase III, delta subunit [Lachnospiraceae bacterium G41]